MNERVSPISAEALEPLRAMLRADGYEVDAAEDQAAHSLTVHIVPTPDACEECLVPASIMEAIIRDALGTDGEDMRIDVLLPMSDR